tara:strand:+ start:9373 stop:9567 length:195 start_codon:yes stop_codon:yes gene_type:complete
MQLFIVTCDCKTVSVWADYSDAEAAASEAGAMDPEVSYQVETVNQRELLNFWDNNPEMYISGVF